MSETEIKEPPVRRPLAAKRKAVSVSPDALVGTECLAPGQPLPLVARPAVGEVDLAEWAAHHRDFLEAKLVEHGAILFRDFPVNAAADFERVVRAVCGEILPYNERSSPRSQVGGNVYTSTDYPPDQSIFPHNEHSYTLTFPRKLFFYCETPAARGGETPLGDTRKIFARIRPAVRERFIRRGWMYVRNFGEGFGLSWQAAFQTSDRTEVEAYCREAGIEFEWRENNRLRTRQVRPAVARHPRTGETVWFNHATFFHVSTLAPALRDSLTAEFKEEDLPNNTYYGDHSPVEPAVLDELRAAYTDEMVAFDWRKRDVVMLDNMLTAHARAPYSGPRRILFAMAEPYTRQDV